MRADVPSGPPAVADPGRRQLRLRREAWGFAIGSLCFLVGAIPFYAEWAGPVGTGVTFVVGSVFFTLAAFVQLSLSGRHVPRRGTNRADRWDWWAAAVQFAGTLLFNLSTVAALAAAVADPTRLGAGWRPDAWGSAAFLVSSTFAIVATRDRGDLWDRHARSWHGTWLNMIGSIAFAVSAIGAYVVPVTDSLVSAFWANLGTLIGALCFLVAALLSRRAVGEAVGEAADAAPDGAAASA
ncbi:YrhK family protein [Agromyces sp. Leaf222]|uniref:YrhK family protein n=1 Tax=Agromyces sp. Leaf222 TaxID=1735688 RepID=UPI0006F1EB93|nr:YrhK family protein [Agromyces sp. Leaf222]KQM81978.1 NADH-ubiquinone oxidoreductase [Agromyces sp. Leaf222]